MQLPILTRLGLWVSLVVAVFATMLYFVTSLTEQRKVRFETMLAQRTLDEARTRMDVELRRAEESSKKYEQLLDKLNSTERSKNAVGTPEIQEQLLGLKQTTDDLKSGLTTTQSQMSVLTGAIGNDPEKVLSVPLLRKDVEDWKGSSQREIDSLREEMGRSYELNKWLIGLILAAVIGTVINNMLQAKAEARNRYPTKFE
jgi:hypothetical protein